LTSSRPLIIASGAVGVNSACIADASSWSSQNEASPAARSYSPEELSSRTSVYNQSAHGHLSTTNKHRPFRSYGGAAFSVAVLSTRWLSSAMGLWSDTWSASHSAGGRSWRTPGSRQQLRRHTV